MRKQNVVSVALVSLLCVVFAGLAIPAGAPQEQPDWAAWTDAQKEEFLRNAEIVSSSELDVGITNSSEAVLENDGLRHNAHIQTVDQFKIGLTRFPDGGAELNFRDSYKFNIAGYRLDRLLNLNMVPVSVERRIGRETGAVTWWVDNVQMVALERYEKQIEPPDQFLYNDQMYNARVFNELIYNTDPNLGNVIITDDWQVHLIDFTRGFRDSKKLFGPENLDPPHIDRRVYEGLQALDKETLEQAMDDLLSNGQIDGILGRRDVIMEYFDEQIAQLGEAAVICDLPGH